MGEALKAAYKEYLERMLLESPDLVEVDQFTVPEGQDITPEMLEFADFV